LGLLFAALAAAALAGPGPLWAQEKLSRADEALLESFARRYQGLATLRADYIRSTVTPSTDPVFRNQASQTASGTLYWKKPYNLRLTQTGPEKEEMVADGSTAWWHIPREKLVYVYRDLDLNSEFRSLMSFFDGLDALRKNFSVSAIPPGESRGALKGFLLTPLSGEKGASITVFCDSAPKLQGFRLNSAAGERTDFFFSFVSANPTLAADLFVFKTPKGAEVIEESAAGGGPKAPPGAGR
jgi:outer membrane lipoprotein carrier protein